MSRDTGEAFYCGATCETTKNRKSGYVSNAEGVHGFESRPTWISATMLIYLCILTCVLQISLSLSDELAKANGKLLICASWSFRCCDSETEYG